MASEDKDETEQTPDIKVDITNGKHIEVDFDPQEWLIIAFAVVAFAWVTGLML